MSDTTDEIKNISVAISAVIAVISALYTLGEKAWPQIKGLFETMQTLWTTYMAGGDISEDDLAKIRARVDEVYKSNMKLDAEKFGIKDVATKSATGEG